VGREEAILFLFFIHWLIKLATVQCKRILLRIVKYKCTSLNWMEKGPGNETSYWLANASALLADGVSTITIQ